MKTELIIVTWNNADSADVSEQKLCKSFKFFNPERKIHQIHFNRGRFHDLEIQFEKNFGCQYEFILYRMFLLRYKLRELDMENIVLCDTGDVTCMGNINEIPNSLDLNEYVFFGMERNQWPTDRAKEKWNDYKDYSGFDRLNNCFLNAGTILAKRETHIELLEKCVNMVLPRMVHSTREFCAGDDQAAFTYYYNNFNQEDGSKIKLDYSNVFSTNTYKTSPEDYVMKDKRIYSKQTGIAPLFIHDNGWDHGSPRIHDYFKLDEIYRN
jgi:hypothetical protein